jgi:hypothetical protein
VAPGDRFGRGARRAQVAEFELHRLAVDGRAGLVHITHRGHDLGPGRLHGSGSL